MIEGLQNWEIYSPIILIVVWYLTKNRLFVTPTELEKRLGEVKESIEAKYVNKELYKEVSDNLNKRLDSIDTNMGKIYDTLIKKGE